jgi:hypothetical protein
VFYFYEFFLLFQSNVQFFNECVLFHLRIDDGDEI